MEKAIIGAVLKRRIKEKGYTQERFAEVAGVKHSTLKKYLSGKATYSYELLIIFADILDCSFEYLLGYSQSPNPEHHEIAEQTRLSEEAISKIVKYASHYDDEFEARRYIKCLDRMLCEDGMFSSICDFLIASKPVNDIYKSIGDLFQMVINANPTVQKLGIEEDRQLSLETIQMIEVICKLKGMKADMTKEFIAELNELDTKEHYEKEMKKIEQNLRLAE